MGVRTGSVLRLAFFVCFVRPLVFVFLGVNTRNRHRLPDGGPAIVVANHNSHLDTLVLMSLFRLKHLHGVRPVAAADYWMSNRAIGWFATHIMRIVPIDRVPPERKRDWDPLAGVSEALNSNHVVIFFPEGSRGEAEKMQKLRSGIKRLAERHPQVPIVPIFLHGLGKSLPKGEGILVPFICDVFVGTPMCGADYPDDFLPRLQARIDELSAEAGRAQWD